MIKIAQRHKTTKKRNIGMMEYWNSKLFQFRRTGVLARTCAGEDACTPEWSNSFPDIPLFPYSNIPVTL
jgi:hypothetical protein